MKYIIMMSSLSIFCSKVLKFRLTPATHLNCNMPPQYARIMKLMADPMYRLQQKLIELNIPSRPCMSNLVWINENEMAFASDTSDDEISYEGAGIWIYNIISNKWRLYAEYPDGITGDGVSICYNPGTNVLWVYGEDNFFKVNMSKQWRCSYCGLINSTVTHQSCQACFEPIEENEHPVFLKIHKNEDFGKLSELLIIDNTLHAICGDYNKTHSVWSDEKYGFEVLYTFPTIQGTAQEGMYGHSVIHIRKRNILYLFGGYQYLNSKQKHYLSIWRCDIDQGFKWTKLSDKLAKPVVCQAAVPICNEKYIILFSRYHDGKIQLFDVEKESLQLLDYKFNQNDGLSSYNKFGAGNNEREEMIINGYIRRNTSTNIPQQLMKLVYDYYCLEMIYLVDSEGFMPKFNVIDAEDILSVLRE